MVTGLQLKTNDGLEKSGRIHASPPLYHTQQCKLIANHGGPPWGNAQGVVRLDKMTLHQLHLQ